MVTVTTDGLNIELGEFRLTNVTMEAQAGVYFVLLGPTGAGKTVLVECIAGLHKPASGRVLLGGRDVTELPPEDRDIGYVPQDYALFPHMTIATNIAFGMKVRRFSSQLVRERTQELAALLHIDHLLSRYPLTLSGGEKQRAALARALAVKPKVLLLDEPLAAVDEGTRDRLCVELREIQRNTGVTVLHVSHSFEETLALADQVGVMRDGQMVQYGTPDDIFHRPATSFIAEFTRTENIFAVASPPTAIGQDRVEVTVVNGRLRLAARCPDTRWSQATHLVVRPEDVRLVVGPPSSTTGGDVPATNALVGRVTRVTNKGALRRVEVETEGGVVWVALVPRSTELEMKDSTPAQVSLVLDAKDLHLIVPQV